MSSVDVECRDLCFSYPDGTQALRDISVRILPGEAVGVVGANGAGKSTFLLHTNGTLLPTSGSVVVRGIEVDARTRAQARRHVGFVFQDPDDQLFMPTVLEDVAFGPANLGLSASEAVLRARQALSRVGAEHLESKAPHQLSGGQKSAVAIAGVLAMDPDILVLDEPAAYLDPKSRRALIVLLKTLTHTRLIAAHDLDLILDVCPRCIVLGAGRVVADGPTREIFGDARLLADWHLEPPLVLQGCPVCGAARSRVPASLSKIGP